MAQIQETKARQKQAREIDYISELHVKLDDVLEALSAIHEMQVEVESRLENIEMALMAEGLGLADEGEVDD